MLQTFRWKWLCCQTQLSGLLWESSIVNWIPPRVENVRTVKSKPFPFFPHFRQVPRRGATWPARSCPWYWAPLDQIWISKPDNPIWFVRPAPTRPRQLILPDSNVETLQAPKVAHVLPHHQMSRPIHQVGLPLTNKRRSERGGGGWLRKLGYPFWAPGRDPLMPNLNTWLGPTCPFVRVSSRDRDSTCVCVHKLWRGSRRGCQLVL